MSLAPFVGSSPTTEGDASPSTPTTAPDKSFTATFVISPVLRRATKNDEFELDHLRLSFQTFHPEWTRNVHDPENTKPRSWTDKGDFPAFRDAMDPFRDSITKYLDHSIVRTAIGSVIKKSLEMTNHQDSEFFTMTYGELEDAVKKLLVEGISDGGLARDMARSGYIYEGPSSVFVYSEGASNDPSVRDLPLRYRIDRRGTGYGGPIVETQYEAYTSNGTDSYMKINSEAEPIV